MLEILRSATFERVWLRQGADWIRLVILDSLHDRELVRRL